MRRSPHPFTLRQLQYAVAVAEELSFRRAADRCAVSQPALSTQLAALEGALGVRLFERDRRRVIPTTAGRDLVGRARTLLLTADDLLGSAKSLGDPFAGTLVVGVIPTVAPYLLPAIAPAIRKRLPNLEIRWLEEKTPVLLERLSAGAIDGAILAVDADLGDSRTELVSEDPFLLAMPRGHRLAIPGEAKLSELRGETVLLLEEGHCLRQQALELCSRNRAREAGFRATSLATLVQMVAAGAGVTLLPALACETEAKHAALEVRRFAPPVPHRTIGVAFRGGAPTEPVLREIAAAARDAWPHPAPRNAARR